MGIEKRDLEEKLLKKRYESESLQDALADAEQKDEELKTDSGLPLEEVVRQMGTGMVYFPDAPVRFRVVQFFNKRLSLVLPVDYLNRHTTQDNLAVLVNDAMGISLSIQFTTSRKKNITLEEVKKGLIGQLKAAGIYIELIEDGEVEDETAPLHFITYRMPMAQGVMYHLVFYAINQNDGAMIIGDYNCFYKDIAKWENIMKATMSYLDFK